MADLKIRCQLKECVFESSEEKNDMVKALKEWIILSHYETHTTCKCGKKHVVNVYRLLNRLNGNILDPIGSECIKKFENPDLLKQIDEINEAEKKQRKQDKKLLKAQNKSIMLNKKLYNKIIIKPPIINGDTIFENTGKKYDGKTYQWICDNDKKYVLFLKDNSFSDKYKNLVKYFLEFY